MHLQKKWSPMMGDLYALCMLASALLELLFIIRFEFRPWFKTLNHVCHFGILFSICGILVIFK
jgi:hypothetical protein